MMPPHKAHVYQSCTTRAIDKFVEEWKASGNPLHLLVHCAGVMLPPHGATEDGFEMQIGVNHIAVAHLTKLMTDTLIASAPARVVMCCHVAAARGKMTGIDLMCALALCTGRSNACCCCEKSKKTE